MGEQQTVALLFSGLITSASALTQCWRWKQ